MRQIRGGGRGGRGLRGAARHCHREQGGGGGVGRLHPAVAPREEPCPREALEKLAFPLARINLVPPASGDSGSVSYPPVSHRPEQMLHGKYVWNRCYTANMS